MNVGMRIGMAVGAGALGTVGAGMAIRAMHGAFEGDAAKVRQQTADARAEFDTWNAKLQERFPDGKLDTPQDHREFEQFLAAEPAPEWLNPSHEGFTDVHTSPHGFIDWPHRLSSDAPGFGIGIALSAAAAGSIAIGHGVMRGGSTASTVAKIVGGVAALSVGAIAGYIDIGAYNADTGGDERTKLIADATMPRSR